MNQASQAMIYPSEDHRWQAVCDRDPAADGVFFYAVKTTGIFCRPGCASRLPKRHNVEFFSEASSAASSGYRPCKRCQPTAAKAPAPHAESIARCCRRLEEADETPSLSELAAEAGLSQAYFHRLFKQTLGVTPRQYAASHRMGRFRHQLERSSTVTEAIYAAGFGSSSRAYENVSSRLGMTPSTYQKGGRGLTIRYATAPCSLGRVVVAATDHGICAIELAGAEDAADELLRRRFPNAQITLADDNFTGLIAAVASFVDAPDQALDLPIDVLGTAFQRRVWQALRQIPLGSTVSYSELAAQLGNPGATRAVASACAANPLALLVPCHRVGRADGGIGGYRWGVERKLAIRQLETELSQPEIPAVDE